MLWKIHQLPWQNSTRSDVYFNTIASFKATQQRWSYKEKAAVADRNISIKNAKVKSLGLESISK